MGRAMLIMCVGLLMAMGYTFMSVSQRRNAMGQQNVKTFNHTMAQNAAHTGVQVAINKFNENNTWRGPETVEYEGAQLKLSLTEVGTGEMDTIKVTSFSAYSGVKDSIIAIFDISENQALVPEFVSPLNIATDNFTYAVDGSSTITGINSSDGCPDVPAITVTNQDAENRIEEINKKNNANVGNVAVDNSVDFTDVSKLIDVLVQQPGVKFIKDSNYKGSLGTATNPQITVIDQPVKLSGGIEPGYGILIITKQGDVDVDLEVEGNFEFNGLVIFENAYNFDAKGTPDINGSIIVGTSDDYEGSPVAVDIGGNVTIQYDCRAKNYADRAINNILNTTLYRRISIYE